MKNGTLPTFPTKEEADREKNAAALASVTAAVLLTALKLVVGLSTNSLGILSEAAHSGLDLLAAGVTYFAVRYSSLPPDRAHPYGHGKIENLSALAETLLLLVVCVWIIWEAVDRIFFNPVVVRPTLWAAGVLIISILVDISRSRMLRRIAQKYRSQALEADALHFSTDILSSAVVLLGIGLLYTADFLPPASPLRFWLAKADSLAALGVSAIIMKVSWALGARAINILLDSHDARLAYAMREAISGLPGIRSIKGLRLRHSGSDLFAEITLSIDGGLTLEEGEAIRLEVEKTILGIEAHTRASIMLIPHAGEPHDPVRTLRMYAAAAGLKPHAVELLDLEQPGGGSRLLVELHTEFPPETPLEEAWEQVARFEEKIRREDPRIMIATHLEPLGEHSMETLLQGPEAERIQNVVMRLVSQDPNLDEGHQVLVRSYGEGRCISFHCRMTGPATVAQAHEAAIRLQQALHRELPELHRVTVHTEPYRKKSPHRAV